MSTLKLTRTPDREEAEELNTLRTGCLELLKENNLPADAATPKESATALRQFIDLYKANEVNKNTQEFDKIDLAYGMGEIYAKAVIDTYHWEYQFLEFEDGFNGFAVVSTDKKWCVFVHHYFHNLLHDKDKSNNSLLNYNMLAPEVLQGYKSNGYTSLS